MDKKYKSLEFKVKGVDEAKSQIRFTMSTPSIDRHGEIIDQKGWKLDEFLKNPVVLWAHDQWQPAIGKVIDIGFDNGNLEGTVQFAAQEYDFAATIFKLYAGGYMNAVSVGFGNDKWLFDETNDQVVLLENTLYELSCVNVPANAQALAKSKGIDISPLERKQERTHRINDKILGKDKDVVEPPIHETPEETIPDGTDDEEEEEDKKKPTVSSMDDHVIAPTDDEVEKAVDIIKRSEKGATLSLELLSQSSNEVIRAAVKELKNRLDVADADKTKEVDSTPAKQGRKKYSYGDINRIIRSLHQGKRK